MARNQDVAFTQANPNKTGEGECKITYIYHSADFDGIASREVGRHYLPQANFVGWDYGDAPLEFELGRTHYVVDLNPNDVFGEGKYEEDDTIWIDHHASAIASHKESIEGIRIDGVAACRLAWQWFKNGGNFGLPEKADFVDRFVSEPVGIRLIGEYDVWDKRDPDAESLQLGLAATPDVSWKCLFENDMSYATSLVERGETCANYRAEVDRMLMDACCYVRFEGLTFLYVNGMGNSLTFKSRDLEENDHDALMMVRYHGRKKQWVASMYHSQHNTEHDLGAIAVEHDGGGHKGACGFVSDGPIPEGATILEGKPKAAVTSD